MRGRRRKESECEHDPPAGLPRGRGVAGQYYDIYFGVDDAEIALLIRALDVTQNVFDELEKEILMLKAKLEEVKNSA